MFFRLWGVWRSIPSLFIFISTAPSTGSGMCLMNAYNIALNDCVRIRRCSPIKHGRCWGIWTFFKEQLLDVRKLSKFEDAVNKAVVIFFLSPNAFMFCIFFIVFINHWRMNRIAKNNVSLFLVLFGWVFDWCCVVGTMCEMLVVQQWAPAAPEV